MDNTPNNRPRGREKNVTGSVNASDIYKKKNTGNGPAGKSGAGPNGRPSGGSSIGKRAAIGGGGLGAVIIALIMAFSGGLFGGGTSQPTTPSTNIPGIGSLLGGSTNGSGNATGGVTTSDSKLDDTVATGSRAKRTILKGGSQDTVTIMVYMCGTDLESKSGMASSDLQEMASATISDKVNLIIYTGGCKGWKISGISNQVNQIYQVKDGKLKCLEADMGNKAMTDPSNLTTFIKYCTSNFPANRNDLILWDHGGGSVTGYGYDETHNVGSMTLAGINTALKNAGTTFDFIGFDACLMATAETALMLDDYADYLIASEETEPGIGWYYTNWLTKLSQNTSIPTIELGKVIVDDFVETCAGKCRGQKTTLSVTDLAEFAHTIPDKLTAFAQSISTKLTAKEYDTVSEARSGAREFATSSRIDQIDLCDLAENMNNAEGKALSKAIQAAVKYNKTSTNMTNAYGISIYFPYQKANKVDSACNTYNQIGMDSAYAKCIQQFASLETSGQIAAGGATTASPVGSLFGNLLSSGSSGNSDMIGQLLGSFLSNKSMPDLSESNTAFMQETALSAEDTAEYLSTNYFDTTNLAWVKKGDTYVISMPDAQWKMLRLADKSMFFDDGEGYIDLGMDNTYDWNDDKDMVADMSTTWLAINGQVVAYYHTDTIEKDDDHWTMQGYVPALLNGTAVKLQITFDQDNKNGYISGVTAAYINGETDTVAKSDVELNVGDTLEFTCDYYDYDGKFQSNYTFGEPMTVTENMTVSDVEIKDAKVKILYCFTDLYNQEYWTLPVGE